MVAVASVVDLAAAEVAVAHRRDIRIEIPNMPVVVPGHICLLTVVPVWNHKQSVKLDRPITSNRKIACGRTDQHVVLRVEEPAAVVVVHSLL